MKTVVMGLDGTAKDLPLVEWVADFTNELGAAVVAIHAIPRPTLWLIAGAQANSKSYSEELRTFLEHEVLRPFGRERAPHLHIRTGEPARELADAARQFDAQLIAIGGRHHSAMHDAVFGNVERELVRITSVPIVTVPYRTTRMMHATR